MIFNHGAYAIIHFMVVIVSIIVIVFVTVKHFQQSTIFSGKARSLLFRVEDYKGAPLG
jgi:hypothetical protein